MVRFIHSSDWQLGMTRHFLAGEAQARFTQDRIDAVRTLGRLAREHRADFILVAGDVFEDNKLSGQTVARTLEAIAETRVPVVLLPGNHDPLDAASLFRSAAFRDPPENVILLDDEEPRTLKGMPDVEIVGAPWYSKQPSEDLVAALRDRLPPPGGRLRIAVAHGQIDSLSPELRPDTIALDAAEAAIREGHWHYLALGDRHSVTRVGDSGSIWYSGAPEPTDFTENRSGFALLVELARSQMPRVTELPVGRWRFVSEQRFANGPEDVDALGAWLSLLPDKARCIVRLGFEGLNLADWSALQALLEGYREQFASLAQQRDGGLAVVPDARDLDAVALSGYAGSAWVELVEAARDADDQEARDALALFYRLARGEARR